MLRLMAAFLISGFSFLEASPTYPIVGPSTELYHSSTDFPGAAPGDDAFWEGFRQGADANFSKLRIDGQWHFFVNHYNRMWRFHPEGNSDDPLGMKAMTSIKNYVFYDQDASNALDTTIVRNNKVFIFMGNMYKADNGDLYGFLHIEDYGRTDCPPGYPNCTNDPNWHIPVAVQDSVDYRIGLAYCSVSNVNYPCDNGGWLFLGSVVEPKYNGGNPGLAPFIVKGDYLIVYFNEAAMVHDYFAYGDSVVVPRLSAARVKISDMEAQAANHKAGNGETTAWYTNQPSPWKKFTGAGGSCTAPYYNDDDCWTVNPITGFGAAIIPQPHHYGGSGDFDCHYGVNCLDLHTQAVYSTFTEKYYLLVVKSPWGFRNATRTGWVNFVDSTVELKMYSSSNGVQWDSEAVVLKEPNDYNFYPTIVPTNLYSGKDDGREVESSFDLVYQITSWPDSILLGGGYQHASRIYRKRINLVPNPAAKVDYDGDGISDISVKLDGYYGDWFMDFASTGFSPYGMSTADAMFLSYGDGVAAPGDYDGDGVTDRAIKDEYGNWKIDFAANGFGDWDTTYTGWGGTDFHPVPADYDGDGKTDLAVFNDGGYTGTWVVDTSGNGFEAVVDLDNADLVKYGWHVPSQHPVPADYDGDGKADLAFKDDDDEGWYIDYSSNGYRPNFSNYSGEYDTVYFSWGGAGYKPAPADYDGDGKADLAVLNNSGQWYVDYAANGFSAYGTGGADDYTYNFYSGSDPQFVPTPGDYDGDGKADLSAKTGAGDWGIDYSSDGFSSGPGLYWYSGWGDSTYRPLHKPAARMASLSNRGGLVSFTFNLDKPSPARVVAYSVEGKQIGVLYDGQLGEGTNRLSWSRKDLSDKGLKRGMYFLSLQAGSYKETKRLGLVE